MKTLGVIGGLGPMATAYYLELVTKMTDASCDQEHLKIVIWSRPDTPDRTRFILGLSQDDPRGPIVDSGRRLVSQGAECLAIPCITAHYFHDEIERLVGYPVINLPAEVVSHLKTYGWNRIGIMATDGTIQTGLFQRELEKQGMSFGVSLFGLLPVLLYGPLYLYKTVYAPEDKRWDDFYAFNKTGKWPISFAAMFTGTFLICLGIMALQNL